eukprot:CAMPEP_0114616352 /NCGR_PEP_ID=MMETSP0168-20121206/6642_1 /TAXON_ID=95228 ORGANISM="Vannella sp., Strain DIVA3 517/6/12" /NCGR_SAMPLE_ID=MMETSP0168 /ASSEMBLY_ACC=CAM_ASM_000044 /LENGTH=326 /DNA_ID=CAMNT_0001827463 /DNA_START=158 /DNA_END=1137 /DNA_ORIENTATION=-
MDGDGVVSDFDEVWRLDMSEIEMGAVIGRGAFGEVRKGLYCGTPVAVKKIVIQEEEDELYVKREVNVLKSMRHPNIMTFMGLHKDGKELHIVSEYVSKGDLRCLIKKKDVEISWYHRGRIAMDIARAIAYLHSRKVIFRDLKSKNVLLDEYFRAKICDFGFARLTEQSRGARAMTLCGTDDWMAPEVILGMEYDTQADVFSFGIVLFELITRQKVSEALQRSPMDAFDLDQEKTRKLLPADCPKSFSDLAFRCASYEPDNRPDFIEIVKFLMDNVDTTPVALAHLVAAGAVAGAVAGAGAHPGAAVSSPGDSPAEAQAHREAQVGP